MSVTLDGAYNVLITGIGGTGVLTVGAILGMAAHLDEKASSVMDITGMAQKGGAVVTHLRYRGLEGQFVCHAFVGSSPPISSSDAIWS